MEKKKNTPQKNNDLQKFRDDIIRHFDVVAEQMDKKWDLVAEQYGDIADRLERVEERISKIEHSLEAQNEMIANTAVDLNRIKGELEIMRPRLHRKADILAYESLERRVFALEKRR